MNDSDTPSLPVEVIEHIISLVPSVTSYSSHSDSLSKERQTLLDSARVCRALYPVSRHALFDSLFLESPRQINSLGTIAREYPHIARWLTQTHEIIVASDTFSTLVLQFASHLPKLTSLTIRGHWPRDRRLRLHPTVLGLLSSFGSLASLCLDGCQFRSFSQIQRLVYSLPHLSTLHVLSCKCNVYSVPKESLSGHRLPHLVSLSISGDVDMSTALHSWLSRTMSAMSIRRLDTSYDYSKMRQEEALYSLLASSGPSLLDIELGLYFNLTEWLAPCVPSITRLVSALNSASLQQLRLHFYSYPSFFSTPSYEQIPINSKMVFGVKSIWKEFDDALSNEHFDQLRAVQINVEFRGSFSAEWDTSTIHSAIQERLPALFSRGILWTIVQIDQHRDVSPPIHFAVHNAPQGITLVNMNAVPTLSIPVRTGLQMAVEAGPHGRRRRKASRHAMGYGCIPSITFLRSRPLTMSTQGITGSGETSTEKKAVLRRGFTRDACFLQ